MRFLRMAVLGTALAMGATAATAQNVSAAETPCLALIQGNRVVIRGADSVCTAQTVSPAPYGAVAVVRAPGVVAGTLRQRRAPAKPPAGYRNVWNDGRLNPARGATVVYVAPR